MKNVQIEEIKRKLRQLKRVEVKIRFGEALQPTAKLVWNSFFDTRTSPGSAKYSLEKLTSMSKEAYRAVVDEYFAYVYYEVYKESGVDFPQGIYDPEILIKLGLAYDAGTQDIKRRFRELAKEYHPDTGGDAVKFIELMDTYRQLITK